METTIMGFKGTTIGIHSFIPSQPNVGFESSWVGRVKDYGQPKSQKVPDRPGKTRTYARRRNRILPKPLEALNSTSKAMKRLHPKTSELETGQQGQPVRSNSTKAPHSTTEVTIPSVVLGLWFLVFGLLSFFVRALRASRRAVGFKRGN